MKRARSATFVAEFPLRTSPSDERELSIRLNAACQIFNACLGESLKRLARMRASTEWALAKALPKRTKGRTKVFQACNDKFGFTQGALKKYAQERRDACWIGDHFGSHDTQSTSDRAFAAVQQYGFGKKGRPRFKGYRQVHSIDGYSNIAVLRFKNDNFCYDGLTIPLIKDPRDKDGWEKQALACKTKFCRVVRRTIKGRDRFYLQLIQEGIPPIKARHKIGKEIVGFDVGPSTVAVVSETQALLIPLCPNLPTMAKELRKLDRKIDRQRRANNPENYSAKGVPLKNKKWIKSNHQQITAAERREIHRCLAAERKRAHGELANQILAIGYHGKTEKVSVKSWQKRWGKSIGKKAPSMLMAMVGRKAASAGGRLEQFSTRTTKLSQFDHTTGEYVKKPLSQRIHYFGDGTTAAVQRDLYSAFLARFVEQDTLSVSRATAAWTSAEPLLRQATESFIQASKKRDSIPNRVLRKIRRKSRAAQRGREARLLQRDQTRGEIQPRKMQQISLFEGTS